MERTICKQETLRNPFHIIVKIFNKFKYAFEFAFQIIKGKQAFISKYFNFGKHYFSKIG